MPPRPTPPTSAPRLFTYGARDWRRNVLFLHLLLAKRLIKVNRITARAALAGMTKLVVAVPQLAPSQRHTFPLACALLLLHLLQLQCQAMTLADALANPNHNHSTTAISVTANFTQGSSGHQQQINGSRRSLPNIRRSYLEELRVNDHECFTFKNDDACSNRNDCRWCSPWCLFNGENTKLACNELQQILPNATVVMPQKILSGMPTLIMIRGVNMNSTRNFLENVRFETGDEMQTCTIISRTEKEIRCILEDLEGKSGKKATPTLRYKFNIWEKPFSWDFGAQESIEFIEDYGRPTSNEDQSSLSDQFTFVHYGAAFLAVFGVLASLASLLYLRRKNARQLVEMVERIVLMQRMKKTLLKKGLYVEYSEVQLKTKLGDGHFGEVYQARVLTKDKQTMEVALKKLRKGSDLAKIKLFLTEGIRSATFRHERILSPVAITIDAAAQMPAIVLPIMANGDLCRYLRKNKVFPIVKLLTFALQIAEGMEYLASINMVHGDLAARNCLLDDKYRIKIGDFGLSRKMYRADYVTINDIYRPIRWMALECLAGKKPRFTLKSDVWSFGVVLWEIFTLGSYPYEEFDNADLERHLVGGYRLHRPLNCPTMVYTLMAKCWSVRPLERPSIGELCVQLGAILEAFVQETNGQTELAHSSVRDHLSYTSLAERFVQNRRISAQSAMSARSDQSMVSTLTHHSATSHWA